MALDYASRAEWCLGEAQLAFEKANYPICIRRSQEALELAVKAVLRYLGVEYPREHDVGEALPAIEERLPVRLRKMTPSLQRLLTELAGLRGPAFYGYEREGIPATRAFGKERTSVILNEVKVMVKTCVEFVKS